MTGTVTVIEQPVTVTVSPPQTVTVTETPVTVQVTVDGNVSVTESPTTVTVTGGDTVLVQEVPVTVEVGSADHPAGHDIGGSDHTGVITAAQHGTPAGDLHTLHAYLPGRAGAANDLTLSTTIQGIINGSTAAGQKLSLRGTSHATPGLVEVQRASVTASAQMFQGLIGAEAQPRWSFGFDATSLVQLGFGVGGATAMDTFIKRTAARALRLVSTSATLAPTLGGMTSTDTQPRWLLTTRTLLGAGGQVVGAWSSGLGGSTAVDTSIHRGFDPGEMWVRNYLVLPNILTAPTPSDPFEVELPLYLYGRSPGGVSGIPAQLFYRSRDGTGNPGTEFGPLGTMRGWMRRFNLQIGGMEVYDASGRTIANGVSTWGLLGKMDATTNSSPADTAYSPALSLTSNITATQTFFGVTGGLPLRGDVIVIGTEKIQVVQTSGGNSVIGYRGAYGTTAAAHTAADPILLAAGATLTLCGADGEPCLQQDTGTTSGNLAAISYPDDVGYSADHHCEQLLIYKFDLRNITDFRLFIGFTDQTKTTMLAADNPAGQYWGLSFSTSRGDTEFKCVSKDGTTQNLQTTDWAGHPFVAQKYYLVLEKNGGADPTVSLFLESWIQIGTTETLTVNLPNTDQAPMRIVAGIRNLAAASKRIRHQMAMYNISPSVG